MAFIKEEGVINSVTLVVLVLSFTRRKLSLGQMWNYASYDNYSVKALETNRMAFCMRMRCWCGGNVQGVCPSFILALPISVFFAIFHMEAPENTQEFFSIAFL